jgi:hypothetical protein
MCSIRTYADQAHARFVSARADLLTAIAELASTEEWRGDGAGNLPSFLAARWQISVRTAREMVRDAEALSSRPALRAAMSAGAISVDQSKALAVLCREDTDDDKAWLEALPFWSLPELEREARKQIARELERRDDGVYLRMRHTPDERYMRGEFQLHPEDGATVLAAIDARIPEGTRLREWDRASANALVDLAKGSDARTTVLLSVSEDDDVASLGSGGFVGSETARRLSCDASVQALYKDNDGKITGIGRRSRTISPALRRGLEERDAGMCVFPGCEHGNYLEAHHIVHVAHGGPTVLSNLVLVCWTHHMLVHEHKWSLCGEAGPHITWVRPDGAPFEPRVRVVLDTS